MSACDGSGTLGCRGCSECARPTRQAPSYSSSSVFPPPAYRTPEWVAEMKAREAKIRQARQQQPTQEPAW